jgi:hypothetical protein
MDSGLSGRMVNALDELRTQSAKFVPAKIYDSAETIDLSDAQNEVLRPELLEFFKTTVEDKLTEKVRERSCTENMC